MTACPFIEAELAARYAYQIPAQSMPMTEILLCLTPP